MSNPFQVRASDSMKDVLERLVGSRVEITMRAGATLSGKLTMVGNDVAVLSELTRKEFYDSVVSIGDVVAVEIRVRDK